MTERKVVRVKDVMKREFDVIEGIMTVRQALETMQHVETKALVVNKRHDDDEYGLLLLSDIARLVLARDRSPERVNVYEIMAKPVCVVDPNMDIRYCARLFERFDLSRAPVVEQRKVVGIVSFTDMVMHGLMGQPSR